ncbi:Protein of unknown function [Pyronema omphalodes CBS 100304]|uniref:Uncharacterized protein n=1 Tax=Pyronema omphalodes (strain CBS 100304) TaxID=1076935 RepID=U4LNE5_PYROM|nr:Protein of unknown function [Pyronema omphalodes CBS 100304]
MPPVAGISPSGISAIGFIVRRYDYRQRRAQKRSITKQCLHYVFLPFY